MFGFMFFRLAKCRFCVMPVTLIATHIVLQWTRLFSPDLSTLSLSLESKTIDNTVQTKPLTLLTIEAAGLPDQ